jgi:solute carrier family 25 carnitine/acylcarnitine transporter 20/29
MNESIISSLAGFAYGIVSVLVGQPLDTVKTRMQAVDSKSSITIARHILKNEGIIGLYRGGLPLIIGGGFIRSAQFGVNNAALQYLRSERGRALLPHERICGILDYDVIMAGFCGGIGRGLVEGPFEYVKVRR